MCISVKILDMFYLMFISAHMVLKEKISVFNEYIYKNIRHIVLNIYIYTYGFQRKTLEFLIDDLAYISHYISYGYIP